MKLITLCAFILLVCGMPTLECMENGPTRTVESSDATQHCSICCDPLTDNEPKVLPCKHIFHAHCIGKWIKRNLHKPTCPLCRDLIVDCALIVDLVSRVADEPLPIPAVPVPLAAPAVPAVSGVPWQEVDDFQSRAIAEGRPLTLMQVGVRHWMN